MLPTLGAPSRSSRPERLLSLEIRVQGLDQPGRIDSPLVVDQGAHRRQGVSGVGRAGAVDAEVVVLQAVAEVPAALQATVHQHRVPGRRRQQQLSAGLGQTAHLLGQIGAGALQDTVEPLPGLEPGADRPVRRGRHGHGADVHHLHAFAGDDELPAGGHGIVPGVLQVVAGGHQAGDDHLVVAPLGKAQADAGQLDALGQQRQVGVPGQAQVDLGIDQRHLAAGLQRHRRQRVHPVAAVPTHPAQHQRLAVVALLDPGIKVAVLVQADEELLQQFLGFRRNQPALGQVRLQIRPKILVQPTQPTMVVPAQPENGMAQAQGLERLVEAVGGIGRRRCSASAKSSRPAARATAA